jgi:hypothetical protein
MDANFRLKLKERGITEPELGNGWSYFAESSGVDQHVALYGDQVEVRLKIWFLDYFPYLAIGE